MSTQPHPPVDRYSDLPELTRRFLETLSYAGDGERIRCIVLAADVFAEFDADTLRMLRSLASKPELVRFLYEIRKEEVEEIENSIELVRSVRRTGRLVRWTLGGLVGTAITAAAFWDKFSAFFKVAPKP